MPSSGAPVAGAAAVSVAGVVVSGVEGTGVGVSTGVTAPSSPATISVAERVSSEKNWLISLRFAHTA
ncbi:hypothetical protein D3C87_2106980 [compost metagenome]